MACQIKDNVYYAPNGQKSELYEDLKNKVGESQAKDLFVLAYTPNFIRDVQQELVYNYKSKFPSTPIGVNFVETLSGKNRTFQIVEKGEKKGRIILSPYKEGYKIKSSLINEKERNKGYGKAVYSFVARKMIDEGRNLYSDQIRTEGADSIWNYFHELGLTDEAKKIIYAKPLKTFDKNGEIFSERVLQYANSLNENIDTLSFVEQEQTRRMLSEFPYISNSEELLEKLTGAFYKGGLFAPTRDSLKTMYSRYEIDTILSDINTLAKVKNSIEKLKRTPVIYNTASIASTYKVNKLNLFGKLETENPYVITQDIVQEYGGRDNVDLSEVRDRTITQEYLDKFKRIPVVSEDGKAIIEEIIYPNAIKIVEDQKIFQAIDALLSAPETVDTYSLEKKLTNWLLNYGIEIEGFTKDLLPSLKIFLQNPSLGNTEIFSNIYREVFSMPVKQREYVTQIENKERDLVYIRTNKSEQEIFDQQNLLQSEIENVYHRIEKVDFEEMKRALKLREDITELEAYKQYFNYTKSPAITIQEFLPAPLTNSLDYLKNEFVADFNIEKIKNSDNGLYNKFKITERGIEQVYNDTISMAEIKAHLLEPSKINVALQEYSVISKQMENLIVEDLPVLNNKYNNRLVAINNFQRVKEVNTDFIKVNEDIIIAKNEMEEFISVEGELFESVDKQGNNTVYVKIEKNNDLNYNELNSTNSQNIVLEIKQHTQPQIEYSKIKKIWKPENIENNFNC